MLICNRLVLVLLLSLPLVGMAQRTGYSFRSISINQGLSQSSVVNIAIDNLGLPWFATQDGLNRYDGKEFRVFNKSFDDITSGTQSRLGKLAVTADNELWMITAGGQIEILNLYNNSIRPMSILAGSKLQPVATALLTDSRDRRWIGTQSDGVYLLGPGGKLIQHFPPQGEGFKGLIQSFFEDRDKRIWVLTDRSIARLSTNGSRAQVYPIRLPEASFVSCGSLQEDRKGNLWLGTYGQGILMKRAGETYFHRPAAFPALSALPEDLKIEALLCDNRGRVWLGTYGKGLYIIDQDAGQVNQLLQNRNDPHSLGFNDVLCIRQDPFGGVWVGTDGGGISYYDERLNNFALHSNANLPDNIAIDQIRSIYVSKDGTIWGGTSNNGLSYISPKTNSAGTIHFSPYKNGIDNADRVVSLAADGRDNIWAGTQGNGIFVVDAASRKILHRLYPGETKNHFADNTAWCMWYDSTGLMWVGTSSNGLASCTEKGMIRYFRRPAKDDQNIRVIIPLDDSMLCIGYEKSGIAFFNRRQGMFADEASARVQWKQGDVIKSLHYAAPLLWIGTAGQGLLSINLKTGERVSITEAQGLSNNIVYGIQPDGKGALWLSTNKGLCRFVPPSSGRKPNHSDFQLYTADDGLQSNEFNTGAHFRSREGLLYFGGINGINYFNPSQFVNNQPLVPIIISSINIDNEPIAGDSAVAFRKHVKLAPGNADLSFTFAGLNFASPGRLNYFYQLEGYDADWIDAGNRNYAAYTNLPAGEYTFRVKASMNASQAGAPDTAVRISVPLPFWKTWWFIGAVITGIALLLFIIYRYRISQLIRMQKVRNRIASDLHDDIGSTLTNISILSELSRKNAEVKPSGQLFLDRISEEVNNSSQALDDIVWSINSSNDNIEQTVARMRRYAAELFEAADIRYTFSFDEKFAGKRLGMEQRRDIFLLYKETLNNIYRHAGASEVTISIALENKLLEMVIRDNGKGFDPNGTTHRNGLKNLQSRSGKWKGKALIESAAGHGTTVRFSIPLV